MNVSKPLWVLICSLSLISCSSEKSAQKKPIVLGDSSKIITEYDSVYLQNYTLDIAPNNKKTSAKNIGQMMVQVDSLRATKELSEGNISDATINGFTLDFTDFTVVFNGLYVNSGNNKKVNSTTTNVSYTVADDGLPEMKILVKNLENVSVEQKITTKLAIKQNDKSVILSSLGSYSSTWYTLVGRENIFVALGTNAVQFNEVNNQKIKTAYMTALRSKKVSEAEIKKQLSNLVNTRSASDAPCAITITSVQFVIKGLLKGKKVRKLIRFDVPH